MIKKPLSLGESRVTSVQNIIAMLDTEHDHFVDVFGGSGVVTLNKPFPKVITYNDYYGKEIHNFFKILREDFNEFTLFVNNFKGLSTIESVERFNSEESYSEEMSKALAIFLLTRDFHKGKNSRWYVEDTGLEQQLFKLSETLPAIVEKFRCIQLDNQPYEKFISRLIKKPNVLFFFDPGNLGMSLHVQIVKEVLPKVQGKFLCITTEFSEDWKLIDTWKYEDKPDEYVLSNYLEV